jgi:hypothetical protein
VAQRSANLHQAGSRGRGPPAQPPAAGTALAAGRASAVAKQLQAGAALAQQHCYWCCASVVGAAYLRTAGSKRWCSECHAHRSKHGEL